MLLLLLLLVNILQAELSSIPSTATNNRSKRDSNDIKGKLVFAHVIFRHGDRTPIKPYPTDPWKNVKEWPTAWGQLTKIGKRQQYALGQWLRKRYDGLLKPTYSRDDIHVRSTDVDRTIMSALSNLAGLYPPVDTDKWSTEIAWQPIPVHTVPERLDAVLAAKAPCPAYDYAYSALMKTSEFKELNERNANLYDYLTKHVGYKVSTLEDILHINNTLYIETLYDKTLPEWTKEVFPSADMTNLSAFAYAVNTYTPQMARLKVGALIKEMLYQFDEKFNHDYGHKVWMYSAHDSTIVNILNSLKVYDMHSPDYTACIMLELRIDEDHQPFVSVYYKKGPETEAKILEIPECGTACPLPEMFSLYEDILPIDLREECKRSAFMLVLGLIAFLILMILFMILVYKFKS